MLARRGKITGSKLKDIYSKKNPENRKVGFYELIADKISVVPSGVAQRDIGVQLEPEAVARFAKESGKKIDSSLIIWERDDNENIGYSPDGFVIPAKKGGKIIEAVEAKCLSALRHIEAYLTKEIPDEYVYQSRQAFIANDDLLTLNMVFYNPLIPCKDYFTIVVERAAIQDEIDAFLEYEKHVLEQVNKIVGELTF